MTAGIGMMWRTEAGRIAERFNQVLMVHGIQAQIQEDDLTVTDKVISDIVKEKSVLSDALVEHLWPSVTRTTVYHYTSREAGDAILRSRILRLTNIEKRHKDGEVRTFCEAHKLTGYLATDEQGVPKYRSMIMANTYYASFTSTDVDAEDEEYFWQNFAGGDGYRLKFDIRARNPDMRRVYYQSSGGEPIPVLEDLVKVAQSEFGRHFIMAGISRLCSFYLPGRLYGREKEYRMLYRTWEDTPVQAVGSGAQSYIELPLNVMTQAGFELSVAEVCSNDQPLFTTGIPFVFRPSN